MRENRKRGRGSWKGIRMRKGLGMQIIRKKRSVASEILNM